MTITTEPLFDGGRFRLYENRVEEDRIGWLGRVKRTDVTYYSDITATRLSGRMLILTRSGLRTNVVLQFKRKEHARLALDIINAHRV
ncbi:hypothetical protein JS530_08060 [Bifidobacterium sp. LC6]|uniref:PH domain-containing protein n=1 Tax=Bifidobacterium colobi TaxID=2809026 RepID=A0ABS5UWG0_9BIFI|nr:hypothetical protein [Bifidobacterium colobi]MBT1175447.1 hypothetical protein [Bifidobacterium colobi]